MTMIRMATLAPVLDSDELMRAIGAAGGGNDDSSTVDNADDQPAAGSRAAEIEPKPSRGAGSPPEKTSSETAPAARESASSATIEINSTLERRIRFEGEVKADAPRRIIPANSSLVESAPVPAGGELPDLRDFIRSKRAALAGFMEQGASLTLDGDLLRVTPRSDIYVRYLSDNRNVIGELASELFGRRIKVDMAPVGVAMITQFERSSPSNLAADLTSETAPSPSLPVKRPVDGAAEGGRSEPPVGPQSPAGQPSTDPRQKLYADPVVQRIFEEFDARLVELKTSSMRSDASARPIGKK
jgi:hypothetical protein